MTSPTALAAGSTARPRIALVGCGRVGDEHRERLRAEPCDIVAVCDPDASALARMANRLPHRPRLFRSEQDVLAAGVAEAIVLCTPHARHAQQARSALEAGVHVLCEKPFVTSADEARALVRLARECDRALFVSLARRSRGHARFLLAASGRIGPLTNIIITRAQPWLMRHRRTWRVQAGEGGGFLIDAGASALDLLLRLVDTPVTDLDVLLQRRGGADVDVRASLRVGFGGDTRADLTLIGDAPEHVERIQLYGQNGSAGWTLREDAPPDLYVRPSGGPSEQAASADFRAPLPDTAFVAALRSGRSFGPDTAADLFDAETVVPLVALLERAYAEAVWK